LQEKLRRLHLSQRRPECLCPICDPECPHLAVFAMETIPPMRELSIDYGIDH
jgi:hypothetical protein